MPQKTAAQKKAQKAYMERFVRVEVRMTPDRRDSIQKHVQLTGESVTVFINRAIDSQMGRDASNSPIEAPTALLGAGAVFLPSDTLKAAREAAEATGEALPDFVGRAVETQAQRDKVARGLKT